MLKHIYLPDVW